MARKRTKAKASNVSFPAQSSGNAAVLQAPAQQRHRLNLHVAIGLCVLTLSVFLQAVNFDFINLDDNLYVWDNPQVQKGLTVEGISYAFTAQSPYWHPVTWLSHLLDCQLFGLNAGGHHFTNIAIHTANVLILFFLLLRLTAAFWRSAIVAALFAIHPLHVESVAWIAERKDVLSCLFWLLTVWMYAGYINGPHLRRKYILALLLFLLAVMSKPTVVTLPFVLLLLDYWPLNRFSRAAAGALIREKIPFFLLSLGSSVVTFVGQKNVGAMDTGDITMGMRIGNVFISYVLYLRDLIWPQSLGVLYPYPPSIPALEVFFSVIILAAITVFVLRRAQQSPYLPVGWFWYLGVLVPMIGIVQVGPQARADRFTYIATIGIFVMVAWGAAEAAKYYSVSRKALIACSAALLFVLAIRSLAQLQHWKNSESISNHTIAITGRNPIMKNNLGSILNSAHREREAEVYFRNAVQEAPAYVDAYTNLGINLNQQQRWADALQVLNQAVRLKPNNADALYPRGVALMHLGRASDAIQDFQDAIRNNLTPVFFVAVAHEYLGAQYLQTGQNPAALKELDTALAMNPDLVEARIYRGVALAALGRLPESEAELTRLRTAMPKDERVLRAWQYVLSQRQSSASSPAPAPRSP